MERTLLGGDLGDGKVGAALGLGQLNALGYLLPHGWLLAGRAALLPHSLSLSSVCWRVRAKQQKGRGAGRGGREDVRSDQIELP